MNILSVIPQPGLSDRELLDFLDQHGFVMSKTEKGNCLLTWAGGDSGMGATVRQAINHAIRNSQEPKETE